MPSDPNGAGRLLSALAWRGPGPRTLVVAAHPDDETIGAGASLRLLRDAYVLQVTDGSPRDLGDAIEAGFSTREDYARARRAELLEALDAARVPAERLLSLDVVDQEASLDLTRLTLRIEEVIRDVAPQVVLTHPYEGGHPDHDACAFACRSAIERLRREGPGVPGLAEFSSYHFRNYGMITGRFLPNGASLEVLVSLEPLEHELKAAMVGCFRSQARVLAPFALDRERFREAPRYDFGRRPHAGPLLYEFQPWGITGARWCELARDAARELSR